MSYVAAAIVIGTGVNMYGNTLPLLAAGIGGGALGVHAAKKLNLGKKLLR